jgi:hypothetical protein
MPPKRARSASDKTAKRGAVSAAADDAAATDSKHATAASASLPLDPPPRAGASTADAMFGASVVAKKPAAAAAASAFTGLSAEGLAQAVESLPTIDEVVLNAGDRARCNDDNSFLAAVAAASPASAPGAVVALLTGFLGKTSIVSAKSFMLCLAIAVDEFAQSSPTPAAPAAARGKKKAPVEAAAAASADPNAALRAVAAVTSAMCVPSAAENRLRGSATDAANAVFFSAASPLRQRLVEPTFTAIVRVLIAAVDAGKIQHVQTLGNCLDGIACAAAAHAAGSSSAADAPLIPIQTLREAAELLATLGRFATIGSPRLRGMISAWNAPVLPARKEAMVVEGGPFRIDVAPEFEVRHHTVVLQ